MNIRIQRALGYVCARKRPIVCVLAFVLALCIMPETVWAGVSWNNACTYYSTYGDRVVFEPYSKQGGCIYYATKANTATQSVLFRTLGWKMTVKGNSGEILQTLYCKLDGSYMSRIHTKTQGGYEYNLYGMHLDVLRNRLNNKASQAFYNGECRLILNACMTIVQNGAVQGSMTDSGVFSGKVYTSYSGISKAAGWSSKALQSLYSYFNKEVDGLFHNLSVSKGTGISKVTGGGYYCYGTRVTVEAKVKPGYTFVDWRGVEPTNRIQHTFFINKGGRMTATAKPLTLTVVLHRNRSASDGTTKEVKVSYGKGGKVLSANGWTKNGKGPMGWALSQGAVSPNYELGVRADDSWVSKYAPKVHLYAVWSQTDSKRRRDDDSGKIWNNENTKRIRPDEDSSIRRPLPNPFPSFPEPVDPIPDPWFDPDPVWDPDPWFDPDPVYEEEDDPEPQLVYHVRFISSAYFEDAAGNLIPEYQGGLAADSRWAVEDGLRSLLRAVIAQR